MFSSFLIVLTFISIFPVPEKFLPDWSEKNLKFFSVMLPVVGILFGLSWQGIFFVLEKISGLSEISRGFLFMLLTLILTGGLHMDGFMDTCDAIFSRRDRETRLKILSDTHAGSFAVIGCCAVMMSKTFLFAELLSIKNNNHEIIFFIPVLSRLGMSLLLNYLPFAKTGGLAVILGSSSQRRKGDGIFLIALMILLGFKTFGLIKIFPVIFLLSLVFWGWICKKIFGGITGDLLGAFVEFSEVIMLGGAVIMSCI